MTHFSRGIRAGGWRLSLVLMLLSTPLSAQVRSLGLQEMVQSAGMIFAGRVADVRSGTDQRGEICTFTTFVVDQPISRVFGPAVALKQYGGNDGRLGVRLEHIRYFQPGENVVVMLYPISDLGFSNPVGLSQAVWNVTPDGMVSGIPVGTLRGLEGLLRKYRVTTDGPSVSMPLSTFMALVYDIAGGMQ